MSTKQLVFRALAWLHAVDNDPQLQQAIEAAAKNDSIDWTAMLAAIGHAIYAASGSPSIASIVAIVLQYASPAAPPALR